MMWNPNAIKTHPIVMPPNMYCTTVITSTTSLKRYSGVPSGGIPST